MFADIVLCAFLSRCNNANCVYEILYFNLRKPFNVVMFNIASCDGVSYYVSYALYIQRYILLL